MRNLNKMEAICHTYKGHIIDLLIDIFRKFYNNNNILEQSIVMYKLFGYMARIIDKLRMSIVTKSPISSSMRKMFIYLIELDLGVMLP